MEVGKETEDEEGRLGSERVSEEMGEMGAKERDRLGSISREKDGESWNHGGGGKENMVREKTKALFGITIDSRAFENFENRAFEK